MLCWHDMRTLYCLPTVACLVLGAMPVQARLGETEKEIEKRYGPNINLKLTPGESAREKEGSYSYKGFLIFVSFFDGKSHAERYTTGEPEGLSDTQIDALLKANAGEDPWRKVVDKPEQKWWRARGGDVVACYSKTGLFPQLMVSTGEYWTFIGERLEQKAKKGVEGF
jgi:hypothetical protein